MNNYKLVIFDVDGTLVRTKSGAKFRKLADDWEWIPGRLERLEMLHNQDIKLGIATNQGGVAFGYLNADQIIDELFKMATEGHIYYMAICSTHPEATIEEYKCDSFRRKPGAGMLYELLTQARCSPTDVLMVGDREEDEQAAKTAGVDFQNADEFFSQQQQEEMGIPEWKMKAVQYLLQLDDMKMVEKDRLYTCSERFGKSRYHLTETEWDSFHITEENTGDKWNKKVTIDDEELPHLLRFLLDRYHELYRDKFDIKHPNHEMTTPDTEDVLGDLDDHPF